MKPRESKHRGKNPWTGLLWLILGPTPLFLVLAYQADRTPVRTPEPETGTPLLMTVAAPGRLIERPEGKKEISGKMPATAGAFGKKADPQQSGSQIRK